MRNLTIAILIVCVLMIGQTSASQPQQKTVVKLYTNLIDGVEGLPAYIYWKFSFRSKQIFKFTIEPAIDYKLLESDNIKVWLLVDNNKARPGLQPSCTYRITISSPEYFSIFGKKVRKTVLTFITPGIQKFTECVEENFLIKFPIDVFLTFPSEQAGDGFEYTINPRDERDVYNIEISVPFNDGINGAPIEQQLEQYYSRVEKAKKHALAWIKSKGQNPSELKIIFDYEKY